jgi:tRNA modification GTPase
MADRETLATCLTPPGQGAIAALAVDGPRAWECVRPLFRTRCGVEVPVEPRPGRFLVGRLGEQVADEVVLTVKRVGPWQRLELHCHGGRANVTFLLDLLAGRGVRVCAWREFLRLTESDRLHAAALIALADAPTARTAAILLDQVNGAFAAALDAVTAAVDRGDQAAALKQLEVLARYAPLGGRLTAPWRVAILGAPNVGKSSLANALAGYQRSIVSPTPGTTLDVVTTRLAFDGWPVELVDTAGVRETAEGLEAEGVRRAREAGADADLRLWVLDASAPPRWPEAGLDVAPVVNKIDLQPAWDAAKAPGAVRVSARTGAGLAELCAALSRRLVAEPPPAAAAVPFTLALCQGVISALGLLRGARTDEARAVVAFLRRDTWSGPSV